MLELAGGTSWGHSDGGRRRREEGKSKERRGTRERERENVVNSLLEEASFSRRLLRVLATKLN